MQRVLENTSFIPIELEEYNFTTRITLLVGSWHGAGKFDVANDQRNWSFSIESDPGDVHDAAKENPEKLAELPAPWEEYAVGTGTVGRACDWGTMFLLMSVRMIGSRQKRKARQLNGMHNQKRQT